MYFSKEDDIYRFENLFEKLKLISTKARLKLINALLKKDCYVCELSQITGIDQPYTSRQLKQLAEAGLVIKYECNNQSFYSLDHNKLANLFCDLSEAFNKQKVMFADSQVRERRTA